MSNKQGGLPINNDVMLALGPEWIRAAINVRDWLREGKLKPVKPENWWAKYFPRLRPDERFDMVNPYCCIGYHIGKQLEGSDDFGGLSPYMRARYLIADSAQQQDKVFIAVRDQVAALFAHNNPSDPLRAANAIEEFLTTAHVTRPWP